MGSLLVVAAALAAPADLTFHHLESVRLRAPIVYVGTVAEVRRVGSLEGLDLPTQGRMEATIEVGRILRAPVDPSRGGAAPKSSVILRYETRAPLPEGEGFVTLEPGERVFVFAETFDKAYPRELFHGPPAGLAQQVASLRQALGAMDGPALLLHGLTPATRGRQARLYDDAQAALLGRR